MAAELSEVDYGQDHDAKAVREALTRFASTHDPRYRVFVFRSSGDHLRAIVVSDIFDNMGASERQNRIWQYLNSETQGRGALLRLFGVHPYSWSEYEREFNEQN